MKNQFFPLSNVSFIFNLEQNTFIYVHSSLSPIVKEQEDFSTVYAQIHTDDRIEVSRQLRKLLKGTFKGNFQFRLRTEQKDKWFRITPFLIRSSSETLIFGNAKDITAEKRSNLILEKYANKKNSILMMLSHELKGPLHLAKNLSEDLGTTPHEEPAMINRLQLIQDLIFQSIRVIDDLTNREFLETMNVSLVKRRVDIAGKVKEYMQELERSQIISQRNVKFRSPRRPVYARLDESKFMQVVNNLVSNALKFTTPGGTISVTIRESASSIIFLFSDNGIGIPKQLQHLLFEKYTKAKRKGLRGETPTGLGLFIVKTIIEWHHGTIEVHSRENEGTTFRIELPRE